MGSYGQVRQWKPQPLDGAEQRLKSLSDKLLRLSDELAEMGTPAGKRRTAVAERMEQIVAGVAATRSGLMRAADAIIGLNHGVEEAETLARANGFGIGDDGAVSDVAPPQDVPADHAEDVKAQRERIQAELLDRVAQILRRADDIDNDLAGVLGKVTNGEIDTRGATDLASAGAVGEGQGQLSVVEPPAKGGPGANAAWWDTLSAAEKKHILDKHPDWIGNRDRIPSADRDKANRAILATEKARLEAEARRLQAELDDNVFGGIFSDADAALEDVRDKLKGIQAIEGKLSGSAGLADDERHYLLGFDSGGDGRAIVAKGNPDTADNGRRPSGRRRPAEPGRQDVACRGRFAREGLDVGSPGVGVDDADSSTTTPPTSGPRRHVRASSTRRLSSFTATIRSIPTSAPTRSNPIRARAVGSWRTSRPTAPTGRTATSHLPTWVTSSSATRRRSLDDRAKPGNANSGGRREHALRSSPDRLHRSGNDTNDHSGRS